MLKNLVSLLLSAVVLLSFCACGEQEQADSPYGDLMEEMQQSGTPELEPAEKRTLRFAIAGEASSFNFLYNFAGAYMKEHPDVLIRVEPIGISDFSDWEELSTQLMAGAGPDVIAVPLSYRVINSGHMEDLYPYMNADPDFREEDYFMNVISSMESDGHLYAIPYSFSPYGIFAMRKDLDPEAAEWFETAETVTYADLIRLYQEIGRGQGVQFYDGFGPDDMWIFYLDSVIDLDARTCTLQSEELRRILKTVQAFPHPEVTYIPGQGTQIMSPGGSSLASSDQQNPDSPYLFSQYTSIMNCPEILFPYEGKLYTQPRVLTSAGGARLYGVGTPLMMAESCREKELAWDFIKFCMADRTEPYEGFDTVIGYSSTVGYSPTVNRNTFAAMCRRNVEEKYEYSVELGLPPIGDKEQVIADAVDYLMALPDSLDLDVTPYLSAWEAAQDDLFLYYLGSQSLNTTLANVQSKIELFLNE